jgi:hypothetical protein
MTQQVSDAGPSVEGYPAPPPLPTPGTGGREEIPSPLPPRRSKGCGHDQGGGAGSRARLLRYAGVMALLVAVWAVSGGGHFWPIWPMIGWGWCLVPQVVDAVSRTPRRGPDGR